MGYEKAVSNQKEIVNPYFSDSSKDYIYKASVAIFSNHFGGILVIKKVATVEHRVVFTTEMGNTIFDFSFKGDDFKVNRIIKQMNKKLLINILKKDFGILVKENLLSKQIYNSADHQTTKVLVDGKPYFYTFQNEQLKSISRIGNQKEKVVFEFSEINDDIARRIKITHKNIKLQIALKAFK